ncbi:hypothetical protein NDU88_007782 [Pleurodeles waltl]|uniref:Uncharacterized protein n=1 Tax=Pleurodeles waltl TaxID=8319 RepID=A0AAV7STG6_PLEWA|nr:hypothetical protein NDU88_007782 [Pleurodeles waltl]
MLQGQQSAKEKPVPPQIPAAGISATGCTGAGPTSQSHKASRPIQGPPPRRDGSRHPKCPIQPASPNVQYGAATNLLLPSRQSISPGARRDPQTDPPADWALCTSLLPGAPRCRNLQLSRLPGARSREGRARYNQPQERGEPGRTRDAAAKWTLGPVQPRPSLPPPPVPQGNPQRSMSEQVHPRAPHAEGPQPLSGGRLQQGKWRIKSPTQQSLT